MRKSFNDTLRDIVQYEFLPLKNNDDVEKIRRMKKKGFKIILEYFGNVLMQK